MSIDLSSMMTETRNPATKNLDQMSTTELLTVMNKEDAEVPKAVAKVIPQIAQTVEWVKEAFNNGGRLFYIGAGTSGRLGVLDASECPPTFSVPPTMVIGIIAGGDHALRNPIEGAEDDPVQGERDLAEHNLNSHDVVVGIAASGRTPYVLGAIDYAKKTGCHTVALVCNKGSEMANRSELSIEVVPGPEVITGSTRLKSGTAQKLVLNMITTASMVGIGKVYQNLMVDVSPSNEKLVVRAENIIMEATGVGREQAKKVLNEAGGSVKLAIVMTLTNSSKQEGEKLLEQHGGRIGDVVTAKN